MSSKPSHEPARVNSAIAFLAAQAFAVSALAQQPAETPPAAPPDKAEHESMLDRMHKKVTPESFTTQAAQIGQAEIELGRMAMEKAQSAGVRQYGQRMVKDHTAAAAQLKKVAAQENLSLPQGLDPKHEAVKEKLSGLQGEAFDREYMKEMAKGHDAAVALFESASQSSKMPEDLKEFAATTLPTLVEHKEMAHSLRHEGV